MDSETNNALEDDPLVFDRPHALDTHWRWVKHANRIWPKRAEDVPDDWINDQCGQCRYYIPLEGRLGNDWGACSNIASPFDGRVMFEHDGCDQYSGANEWVSSFIYLREISAESKPDSG